MKIVLFTFALFCLSSGLKNNSYPGDSYEKFTEFVSMYHKTYNSTKEYWYRYNIFKNNYLKINEVNSNNNSYTLGINKFADLTHREFSSKYFGLGKNFTKGIKKNMYKRDTRFTDKPIGDLPDSVDWRADGLVTNVKDQGQCGSCWAFSAIATLEGQHSRKAGKIVSLSEQNIVDCANNYGNEGCMGGWPNAALSYVRYNGGVDTESSYPYEAVDENCEFNRTDVGSLVSEVINITKGNYTQLMNAISVVGPISVAIDAESDFQFYESGVFESEDCSSTSLDHAVTVVGYGVSHGGKKYYIIKNSWGTDWGEDGYIYFSRDINNMCGILENTCYPIV